LSYFFNSSSIAFNLKGGIYTPPVLEGRATGFYYGGSLREPYS